MKYRDILIPGICIGWMGAKKGVGEGRGGEGELIRFLLFGAPTENYQSDGPAE